MKSIVTFLQLIGLCFVFNLLMVLFVTPTDAWEAFGSSAEGHHLLMIHLLKLITNAAHVSLPLAIVLGAVGGFIDRRKLREREASGPAEASASSTGAAPAK